MAELILIVLSILAGFWIVEQSKLGNRMWDIVTKVGVAYAVYSVLSWLVSAL